MLWFIFNISKIIRYGKKYELDFYIYKSFNKMYVKFIFIYIRGGRMYGYVEGVFDNGCRSYWWRDYKKKKSVSKRNFNVFYF